MVGIGSRNDALLLQRGKVIAIEMDADQVVAAAFLYEPRLTHANAVYHKIDYYDNATMSINSDPYPPCRFKPEMIPMPIASS